MERPDTVHGRLLEAVHIAGYTFERAWQKLEWLLEDGRWRKVGGRFSNVNDFLATVKLPEGVSPERRKKVAQRIRELQPDASQRRIAGTLGVSHTQVQNDLRGGKKLPDAPEEAAPDQDNAQSAGNKLPPAEPTKNDGAERERLISISEPTGEQVARQIHKRLTSPRAKAIQAKAPELWPPDRRDHTPARGARLPAAGPRVPAPRPRLLDPLHVDHARDGGPSRRCGMKPRSLWWGLPLLALVALAAAWHVFAAQGPSACTVEYVIDGDTLRCEDGTQVRLLLIDTPEMDQAPYGRQARTALLQLVQPGDTLRLETDVETHDRYGRLLAHVYDEDGTHVNAALVRRGYAVVLFYAPNDQYVEEFRRLEREAQAAGRGLWARGGFHCQPADWRHDRCDR